MASGNLFFHLVYFCNNYVSIINSSQFTVNVFDLVRLLLLLACTICGFCLYFICNYRNNNNNVCSFVLKIVCHIISHVTNLCTSSGVSLL